MLLPLGPLSVSCRLLFLVCLHLRCMSLPCLSCLCARGEVGDGDRRAPDTAGDREKEEFGQAMEQLCSSSLGAHPRERHHIHALLRVASRQRACRQRVWIRGPPDHKGHARAPRNLLGTNLLRIIKKQEDETVKEEKNVGWGLRRMVVNLLFREIRSRGVEEKNGGGRNRGCRGGAGKCRGQGEGDP